MSGLSQTEFAFVSAFNEIADRIHQWALSKGFWPFAPDAQGCFATKLCLVHSEISECLEADRGRVPGSASPSPDRDLPHRDAREVELADAVIRIMDLASASKFDLGGAIVEKMAFNQGRPHRHGKAY